MHKLIALNLIDKDGLLTGKECHFLRVQLGFTQQALGKIMDEFSENAVSLWERKDTVPVLNDRWLRFLVIAKLNKNTKVSEATERIQTVERLIHQKYVVRNAQGKRRIDVVKAPEEKQLETD